MTQLLIQGAAILAQGPLSISDTAIRSADAIYPVHVIPGWQIVDAVLPAGFTCAGYQWANGALVAKPPVVVLPTVAQYESAVQNMLDAKAQAFGYDDIKSACTYAGDPDATFNDQGTKFRAWRSQCWRTCYNVMPQVQGGFRSQPSIADLLAMMPPSPL